MPAAFEHNNLVVPLLNNIDSWLRLGKRLVRLRLMKLNTLIIALLIAVKKAEALPNETHHLITVKFF